MAKTYVPTLIRRVRVICIYMVKYSDTIRPHLTDPQKAVFDDLKAACEAFLDLVILGVNP